VDPRAKLADDVEIGPYAVIGEEVELASGVVVGSHVNIMGRTTIGARTRIFPFSVLGAEPQIRGYEGGTTALVIGEDNLIREFATIHVGSTLGTGATRIGDHNMIMNNFHVAHDCHIGSHCVLAGLAGTGGHVVIEDYVVFGGMTGVHQFVRIGESVFTGGNSMVSKDAPPFAKIAGDRAKFTGVNTIGLERRGFSGETIATIKHAYHILFQSKLRLEPAMAQVERECGDSPEVGRLLHFLRTSERGVIR
jgi:UDP-N-acetylglucosamine acyltransferase